MAQEIKALVIDPDDPSSVSSTRVMEEENQLPVVVL